MSESHGTVQEYFMPKNLIEFVGFLRTDVSFFIREWIEPCVQSFHLVLANQTLRYVTWFFFFFSKLKSFIKLFKISQFDHQTLQLCQKNRAIWCRVVFSWCTRSFLGLSPWTPAWCLGISFSYTSAPKFADLCNSFLCTFNFPSLPFFFFNWGVKGKSLSYIWLMWRLYFRIRIKCDNSRTIGKWLLQSIYFMLWYVIIIKSNTFSYWQYVTERFLVSSYEANTAVQ